MNDQQLIARLRSSGQATLDPERVNAIRHTLLTEFDQVVSAPAQPRSLWQRWQQRPMFATAVVVLALAVLLTGREVVNAARPGDVLYPLDLLQERINTAIRIREERKVAYIVGVAEERFEEQVALENAGSDRAFSVENPRVKALEQALASVQKIQLKVAAKKGQASTALKNVEERLTKLQAQVTNRRLHVEVKLQEKQTRIKVNSRAYQWQWATTTVDPDEVVKEIIDRTGLTEEQVRKFLPAAVPPIPTTDPVIETPVEETPTAKTPKPVVIPSKPKPIDTNRPGGTPEPARTTPASSATVIQVRVALRERKTIVHTEIAGKISDWEIKSTNQTRILARLRAKTKLSNAEITAIWDFEQR